MIGGFTRHIWWFQHYLAGIAVAGSKAGLGAAERVQEFHGFLGLNGLIQGFPMGKQKDAQLI
jgi:hypothetical protein